MAENEVVDAAVGRICDILMVQHEMNGRAIEALNWASVAEGGLHVAVEALRGLGFAGASVLSLSEMVARVAAESLDPAARRAHFAALLRALW